MLAASTPDDPRIKIDAEDLHQLTYTSGTTGNPKGVMISEKAWSSATINILLNYGPITEKDVILNLQQLSHGAGYFVMPFFMRGAANILVDFDPARVFATVQNEGVTVLKLVPVMLYQLMDSSAKHQFDLSSLNHIIYGGSPISRERLVEALGFFGKKFSQLYGQAEVPMCLTTLSREDHLMEGTAEEIKRLESAGKPCINVEVKIVDEDGSELTAGKKGEVIARGEHIMDGYWKNPVATAETMQRRLGLHGRYRLHGFQRVHFSGGPQERRHYQRCLQYLSGRGRADHHRPSGGAGGLCYRHSRRQVGRSRQSRGRP